MILIETNSSAEAWERSIVELVHGDRAQYYTSTEGPCLEIMNVVMHVKRPHIEPKISRFYDFPGSLVDAFVGLSTGPVSGVETVHDRLHRWGSGKKRLDQVDAAIATLREAPASRRAVLTLWNPPTDLAAPHPMTPLVLTLQIRHSALHATAVLRSNDAWLAAPADIKGLTDLQMSIASELGVPVGTYTHHAVSYHIYNFDIPKARESFQVSQRRS